MKSLLVMVTLVFLVFSCEEEPPNSPTRTPVHSDSLSVDSYPLKLALSVGIETGDYWIEWPEVAGAASYVLQSDLVSSFSNPITIYRGPDRSYYLGFPSDYSYSSFYRVQAEGSGTAWSNTIKFP